MKGAPKKFKGKSADVDIFLRHYERMIPKYNLTTDKEQVENITQYCSKAVRQFMEGLSSYRTPNWTQFAKDLRKFYEADKDSRRYKVRDLENFVITSRAKEQFANQAAWMKYNREFIRISGWLEAKGKIDKEERAIYFWKGIPRRFRDRIELRLMSSKPNHDLDTPFDIADVVKAAETLLKRDRFDNDRLPSDSEDSESDTSDSSSDSESESSDDEKVKVTVKKKLKKAQSKEKEKPVRKTQFRLPKKSHSVSSSESESDDESHKSKSGSSSPAKGSKTPSEDDFEHLISRLSKMSIQDPEYATVYFKAYRIDPIIKELVPTPSEQRRISPTTSVSAPRERQSFEREPPPHMSGGFSTQNCFGCGKQGHSMRFCPDLRDLANKGVIRYGPNNQWVMSNGSSIRRNFLGEPLTEAIERLQSSSNLITIDDQPAEADLTDDEVYAIQHDQNPYSFFKGDIEYEDPDMAAYPVESSDMRMESQAR